MIGAAEKEAIAKLREHAETNPLTPETLERLSRGFNPADPSTRPAPQLEQFIPLNFNVEIPWGFKVTFTMEQQPVGLVRHISVSVDAPNRVPHPAAMQMLLEEFGFENPLGVEQQVYPEHYGKGLTSVNVLELVSRR